MIGRRLFLGRSLMAMIGGLPPPRPDQRYNPPAPPGPVGAAAGPLRARIVIVSGPSHSVLGVFVYSSGTTPAFGNPPVIAITEASTDPYGNPVPSGVSSRDFVTGRLTRMDAANLSFSGGTGTFILANQPGSLTLGDALNASAQPELDIASPGTLNSLSDLALIRLLGESQDASKAAQILMQPNNATGPQTTNFLEVQGTASIGGILTPASGTNSSGSAPSPGQALASGIASQLTDTTRDFMLYLVPSGAGNLTIQIGPTSAVGRTILPTSAAVAGALYTVRIPAGWFVKWTGTGTVALASQTVVGC